MERGSGGGSGTDPSSPSEPCNTGDPIIDDPDVHGAFKNLWQQSQTHGTEFGGWITSNGSGNYAFVPFQNPDAFKCGIDVNEPVPSGAVSILHRHPGQLFQPSACGDGLNLGLPSNEDTRALETLGFSVGYLIDHTGIGRYYPQKPDTVERISRCGY